MESTQESGTQAELVSGPLERPGEAARFFEPGARGGRNLPDGLGTREGGCLRLLWHRVQGSSGSVCLG